MLQLVRRFQRKAKRELFTAWHVARHPATPRGVKLFAGFLVAYALSPIDLIPDFIPVIGHLDDAILLPAGLFLLLRFTPLPVIEECQRKADLSIASVSELPRKAGGFAIVAVAWLTAGLLLLWAAYYYIG